MTETKGGEERPANDSGGDVADVSAPPPRPQRPTWAQLAAANSSDPTMRDPPVLPKKPPAMQTQPVTTSAFFNPTASGSTSEQRGSRPSTSPTSGFRPAGSSYSQALARRKSPPDPAHIPADHDSGSDDELRLAGNEGFTGMAGLSPTVERKAHRYTYGKSNRPPSSRGRSASGTAKTAEWDPDNWGDDASVPRPAVATTSAMRTEPRGSETAGDAPWEQQVETNHERQHGMQRRTSRSSHRQPTRSSTDHDVVVVRDSSPDLYAADFGWWTTPRVLAKAGENGSKPGLWPSTSYDFDILDTPEGEKSTGAKPYPAMGTEIPAREEPSASQTDSVMTGPADDASATTSNADLVDDPIQDPDSLATETPSGSSKPKFRTVTREELDHCRPHPALKFCPEAFAWGFFDVTKAGSPVPPSEPVLWHLARRDVPRGGLSRFFEQNFPGAPLPAPIPPAKVDPNAVRSLEQLPRNKVFEIESTSGRVCVVTAQDWYPAVIPASLFTELLRQRRANPVVGQNQIDAGRQTIRFIWRSLDNYLFVGERRGLPTDGKTFRDKVVWDDLTKSLLLDVLGAKDMNGSLMFENETQSAADRETCRTRLLRCWLELSLWLEHMAKIQPDQGFEKTRVRIRNAKAGMQDALGGDELPRMPASEGWTVAGDNRIVLPGSDVPLDPLAFEYNLLGVTPNLADEVIVSVYDKLVDRMPWRQPNFLEALLKIADSRGTEAVRVKVATERSLGRHTAPEIAAAYRELNLPDPCAPETPFITEDELVEALQTRLTQVEHPGRRKVLLRSAKTISGFARSEFFDALLESSGAGIDGDDGKPKMDAESAFRILGVEPTVDDDLLIQIYEIRLSDAANEGEKVKAKDALRVIAEARQSAILCNYLKSGDKGNDAGWQANLAVDPRMPVGLTNIANTCYLNSLLQYFFSIREMRETILAFEDNGDASPDAHQQPIRVGPREATPAEIKRSKRFVVLLKTLFEQLIHAPVSAVTPETELAYLALVPSEQEILAATIAEPAALTTEPEAMKTDSSDRASPAASSETLKSPSSVLGKRKSDESEGDAMQPEFLLPPGEKSAEPTGERDAPSASDLTNGEGDADHERPRMKRGRSAEHAVRDDSKGSAPAPKPAPPPLPPRPTGTAHDRKTELERQVSTYMSFGRQNDVTECMDNVIFQVETALLANSTNGRGAETANLLRRIFYGTMRQKITFDDPNAIDDPLRKRDEPFSALFVDVPAVKGTPAPGLTRDIYDALDTVFEPSQVELEGHSARRQTQLVSPPPTVLQVQLQRVQYDVARQAAYKSNAHLAFDDEIDIGRYLEAEGARSEDETRRVRTLEASEELKSVRARLSALTSDDLRSSIVSGVDPDVSANQYFHGEQADAAVLLSSTAKFGRHLNRVVGRPEGESTEDENMAVEGSLAARAAALKVHLVESLFDETEQEGSAVQEEISALNQRVGELKRELRELWAEGGLERQSRYKLTAVFIHRGTATSGHYYIYQRDPRDEKRWFKYNDSLVTEVDADEIFRETTGDTNPYFLSYVRMDCLDAIETIKREIA